MVLEVWPFSLLALFKEITWFVVKTNAEASSKPDIFGSAVSLALRLCSTSVYHGFLCQHLFALVFFSGTGIEDVAV